MVKRMITDYWIVSVFGIEYDFRIVTVFRTFRRKRMGKEFLIVCVFGVVSVFEM